MTHAAQCQGATCLVTEIGVQMTETMTEMQIVEFGVGKKLMNVEHRTSNIELRIMYTI